MDLSQVMVKTKVTFPFKQVSYCSGLVSYLELEGTLKGSRFSQMVFLSTVLKTEGQTSMVWENM